jgi:hypothetical protein
MIDLAAMSLRSSTPENENEQANHTSGPSRSRR